MAGIDIYLDITGERDLVLNESGDFRFTNTVEESLTQRIYNRMTTWQGEWRFNTEYGTPYQTQYKNSGKTKEELDSFTKSIIFLEDDVTTVNIDSVKNEYDRVYTIRRLEVYFEDGEIEIPIATVTKRENIYPEPMSFEDFEICTLSPEELKSVNDLHNYINHTGLPEYAEHTWWRKW